MRKTSHDGGDSTSVTSGVENEIKKSAMKPKKSSLKRKSPNFSQESDDTVNEPLLQKEKAKPEASISAKLFTKGKTDSLHEKESDKAKLLNDNKSQTTSTTGFCGTTESLLSMKESEVANTISVVAPIHNYMNTNVFNTHDNAKIGVTTKSQILVEIDGTKQSGYSPSPLIFTTAKIHTDGKSKQMEPVQVTPVPIISSVEVSVSKDGCVTTNEKKVSNGSSVVNPIYSPVQFKNDGSITNRDEKVFKSNNSNSVISPTSNKDTPGKSITKPESKLSNNTSVQSNFSENVLPSTSKNLSMNVNGKDKSMKTKDIQKDVPKFENIKNNVVVKTIPLSGKHNLSGVSSTSNKNIQGYSDNDKKKLESTADNKINDSNINPLNITSNMKSPTLKDFTGNANPIKSSGSIVSNKHLQRQKTTTEEINTVGLTQKSNTEKACDTSAKIPSFTKDNSLSKITDSTSKHSNKLPSTSATDNKNIVTKTTVSNSANSTSNVISISKSTKPTATHVSLSDSKPSMTTTGTVIKSPNVNTSSIPKSISTDKSTVVLSLQTAKSIEVPLKRTENTASIALGASSSPINKTTSDSTSNAIPAITSSIGKLHCTDTTTVARGAPITSSIKSTSDITTKPSSIDAKMTPNTKTFVTKTPSATTNATAMVSTSSKTITAQIGSSPLVSLNQKSLPTTSSTSNKSSVAADSVKPSTINAKGTVTTTTIISPNNNTTIPVTTKSSSSIAKTVSSTSEIKTQTPNTVMGSTVNSPQELSATINQTKPQPASTKTVTPITSDAFISKIPSPVSLTTSLSSTTKPPVTTTPKLSVTTTPTPPATTTPTPSATTTAKPSVTTTSKPSAITSTKASVTTTSKPSATTTTKTSITTTSKPSATTTTKTSVTTTSKPSVTTTSKTAITKNSPVTTSIKTLPVTSISSKNTPAATVKTIPQASSIQTKSNKSGGVTGATSTSAPSSMAPTESIKKDSPKPSDKDKDGKVSKA